MNITINGEIKSLDVLAPSSHLLKTVKLLGYNPKLIVVEFNGKILPPNKWSTQIVKEGDRLEIVTIVGGGS